MEPDHIIIVTATPMINRVTDLLGYLNLLWKEEWELSPKEWEVERSYSLDFNVWSDDTLPQHTPIYGFGGELAIYEDEEQHGLKSGFLALWLRQVVREVQT